MTGPDFPIALPVTVAWGEMDAYGHVNNTVFFRYFESARMAFLTRIGFVEPSLNGNIGPILASTECVFRRPLRFPDSVIVRARVIEVSEDRFTMQYEIFSESQQQIVARGTGVIVAYDYEKNAKGILPQVIRDRMSQL